MHDAALHVFENVVYVGERLEQARAFSKPFTYQFPLGVSGR
jgi:hypothetical protein